MSRSRFYARIDATLDTIASAGLNKREHVLASPQSALVVLDSGQQVLNLCSNNYLGLADHPDVIAAASAAMDSNGFGMASVRFICGTHVAHRQLEQAIAAYVGLGDAITYAACFDANGGLFETLFGEGDAIVSDSLNHASIIDGIRLSKATRYRFRNGDMADLETQLGAARQGGATSIVIATDGVFSMDGHLCDLPAICELADRFDALVMVDDAHATGVVGPEGRGTPAHFGLIDRVDLLTGTLGKALGGGAGGFIAACAPVVALLRQRSRPYLFSNALPPGLAAGAMAAIELAKIDDDRRRRLSRNATRFRAAMTSHGFELLGADHPIVPVFVGDPHLASALADRLLDLGVYVTAFTYPVVPRGRDRVRTQMSAAHDDDDVDRAIDAFAIAGRELGLIGGAP